MSDAPRDPYAIEPERTPQGQGPTPTPPPGKPHIEAAPLIDDFEEDADFTLDPEVDRATGKIPTASLANPNAAPIATPPLDKPDFVSPGPGEAVFWAAGGALLLVGAMVATGVNAPNRTVFRILLTLYNVLLHTGTGVVAVYVAATLMEQRVRYVEHVAARMFVAVSALSLFFHMNIAIFPPRYDTRAEEILLGAGVYLLIVAASFKLWKRTPLAYVVGSHFGLWLIVQLGLALAGAVAAAPKAVGG